MPNRKDFSRVDRIRKAVTREFNAVLQEDVKEPELADRLISVIEVEVTRDLRYVRIFLSIMETPEVQERLMAVLTENLSRIRYGLGQRIRLRYTPEVSICLDGSLERGARITALLNKIAAEDEHKKQATLQEEEISSSVSE
jgi:ribosome-binding factor A